ncbi:hypothetical protein ABGT15_12825 [Flavobacterium enshiense]|uniref:hypothetical protein n=1 Tax=Flavobacterium enshiense TaxID=1341165 RepID=UPI00345DDFBA
MRIIRDIMKFLVLIVAFFLIACSAKQHTYEINGNNVMPNGVRPNKEFKFKLDSNKYEASDSTLINYKGIYLCKDFLPTPDNNIAAVYYRFFPNNIIQEVVIRSRDSSSSVIDSLINLEINDPDVGNLGKYKILEGKELFIEILRNKYGTSLEKGLIQAEDYMFITTQYTRRDDHLNLVANNPKVIDEKSGVVLGLFAAVDALDYSMPAIKKKYERVVPPQFSFYEIKLK